jgi:hypothetical protein
MTLGEIESSGDLTMLAPRMMGAEVASITQRHLEECTATRRVGWPPG